MHKSMITPCAKTGTVLAFDFGEKRVGVAVGDTAVGIAHPLTTIDAADRRRRFAAIAALVEEWRPAQLVVGLPGHLDGAPASREQGSRLRDATDRESGAAPSGAGAASVSGVTSPKGAPVPPSDGAEHEMARLARKFARELSTRFGLPVEFVDERLTSVSAELSLTAAGVAPRKRKLRIDQVAAQEILQDYFDTAMRAARAVSSV